MRNKILNWLANGKTEISSKTIAFKMLDIEYSEPCHPHDPDDFRRCMLLLEEVPEIILHFDKMREVSPIWDRLVDRWSELQKTLKEEMSQGRIVAPKTYDIMQEIIYPNGRK